MIELTYYGRLICHYNGPKILDTKKGDVKVVYETKKIYTRIQITNR